MKKNKFMYGAMILVVTGVIAKIIGAVYRVPLMGLIGSSGLGIFQLIFPIYALFLIVATGGVTLGLSKIVSIEVQNKRQENAKKMLHSCLLFMFLVGLSFSLLVYIFSKPLASMQGNADTYVCYLALLPALIFSCLLSAFRGYFQGQENMLPSGITQIIEQIVKLTGSLLLAKFLIQFGVLYAVLGAFLGISISEVVALIYIYIKYLLTNRKNNIGEAKGKKSEYTTTYCIKQIVKVSFPIMINGAILPFISAVESIFIVWLLAKARIGTDTAISLFGLKDGVVSSLINLPSVIAIAFGTALIPSLTASYNSGNIASCQKKCSIALKIVWLISLPCAIAFLFMSENLIGFLYSNGLNSGSINELKIVSDLLKISAVNIVYISFLNLLTAILQGLNKSFVPVKNLLIACLVKIILTALLVSSPAFNIYGLVISDVVCFSIAVILNLNYLKNKLNIVFSTKNFVFAPLFSASVMCAVIKVVEIAFNKILTARFLTLVMIGSGAVAYLFSLLALRTFTKEELSFLPTLRLKRKKQ